jgi:hypothetical protein
MSPDRPEPSSTHQILSHQLGSTARNIVQKVETETGHPVVLQRVTDRPAPHLHPHRVRHSSASHVIALVKDFAPLWDYLVAYECAHALRLFALPANERRVPVVERQRERQIGRFLLPLVQKRWRAVAGPGSPLLPEAPRMARLYHHGLVAQVVNFPVDLRIETWIRETRGRCASCKRRRCARTSPI